MEKDSPMKYTLICSKLSSRYGNYLYVHIFCVCSVARSCVTFCDPVDCSPPGSSVLGISQSRILEWIAISYSKGLNLHLLHWQVDSLPLHHLGSPMYTLHLITCYKEKSPSLPLTPFPKLLLNKQQQKGPQIVDFGLICSGLPYHRSVGQSISSVAQSCLTLCDPMDCSTPGLPVHHQLQEFTQTHVHWVGDAIQPSHPLLSPSPPTFNFSQH